MKKNIHGASIKPLFDYVLIRPSKQEEMTTSGILLPDSAKEKPQIGTIVAVGPGGVNEKGERMPMAKELKTGEHVFYKKWAGTEVKDQRGDELMLVEQKDVIALVG